MYLRKSRTGHRIEWNPENEKDAQQAIAEVEGTGVEKSDIPISSPVDIGTGDSSRETAQKIQTRYKELIN